MKESYGNYYKIFGCACKGCGCNEKNKCEGRTAGAEAALCENAKDQFCFEPVDCNDSLIEMIGLADAYVPYQTEFSLMSPEKSLVCGTVFAGLVIPYKRSQCACTCKNGRGMNG
jgi:hypothetical protein